MSFIETPRFPEGISVGATGGPVFNSRVFSTQSGQESVIALWGAPLHQFDVSFGVKSAAQLDQVKQIFWLCSGQLHQFRYKDWNDYQIDALRGVLVPVSTYVFQIAKVYTFGPLTAFRRITKPVVGMALFYQGAAVATSGYTIDFTTGLVTFQPSALPSDPTQVYPIGEFDVPVRFKTDQMMASIDDFDIQSWGQIPLMEVRYPDASLGTPGAPPGSGGSPSPGPTPPPAPSATTVVVRSGPSSGYAGQASAPFHFGLDGTPAAPVHVTLIGSGSGGTEGTWSPASITLSTANADVTATYTAASAGTKSLTRTNDASLGNGAVLSYSAAAVASPPPAGGNTTAATIAPSSQSAQAGSSVSFTFTLDVTPNPGPLSFNVASSDPNDVIVPNVLSYSGGDPVQKTFGVMTSSAAGTHTITATSTSSPAIVSNAATISVTVAPAPTPPGAPIPLTSGSGVNWTTTGTTPIDYVITVPTGKTNLHIESTGDTNAIIAEKFGQRVDASNNTVDHSYQNPGSVDVSTTVAGDYYLEVYPIASGVSGTLKATVT